MRSAERADNIKLPTSILAGKAFAVVKESSPEYLLNHCVRTYLFAAQLGVLDGLKYDSEILFLSCIMHDLGITKRYRGNKRFEVDGADAAYELLKANGVSDQIAETVWDGIALHATFHIPSHKCPEIALVQLGAGVDVLGRRIGEIHAETVGHILEEYPRKNMKQNIIDDFVEYLKYNPAGGAGYWMSDLANKYVSTAQHFDLEQAIMHAPFRD